MRKIRNEPESGTCSRNIVSESLQQICAYLSRFTTDWQVGLRSGPAARSASKKVLDLSRRISVHAFHGQGQHISWHSFETWPALLQKLCYSSRCLSMHWNWQLRELNHTRASHLPSHPDQFHWFRKFCSTSNSGQPDSSWSLWLEQSEQPRLREAHCSKTA